MINVGLYYLGTNFSIDLRSLAQKMNSIQSGFEFIAVGPPTGQSIGEPDYDDWYSCQFLFDILKGRERAASFKYIIGVTNNRMINPDLMDESLDYFSWSDGEKISVISIHDNVLKYNHPSKDCYQYIAYLIMCELTINISKYNLSHGSHAMCLFDECSYRDDFKACIDTGIICGDCMKYLESSVPQDIILSVMDVLRWCRSKNWEWALVSTIENPIVSLFFGLGIGWIVSLYLGKEYLIPVLLFTLMPPIAIFLKYLRG
jgi:hypothetical protein